jgi:hypothetical protein
MTVPNGDLRNAEAVLLAAAKERDGTVQYFTGLTVGALSSHQGMLVQLDS